MKPLLGSLGFKRICPVRPVELVPSNILGGYVEVQHQHVVVHQCSIHRFLSPDCERNLFRLPVMQQVEESQAWQEDSHHSDESFQCPSQAPQTDADLRLGGKINFLIFNALPVTEDARDDTPATGQT